MDDVEKHAQKIKYHVHISLVERIHNDDQLNLELAGIPVYRCSVMLLIFYYE